MPWYGWAVIAALILVGEVLPKLTLKYLDRARDEKEPRT